MSFSDLVGKVLESVEVMDDERIVFRDTVGVSWASYHMQDCCETVRIEEVKGDIKNVLGLPILVAEETCDSTENPPENPDSWTRTFQRVVTANGEVTFVWLGESNGYYGETPYFGLTH